MFNSNFRREDNETSELEKVSDDNLSVILNDEKTRDYIAPRGIMLLHWTPLKPIVENISTIRGIEGSTNIYSDIKPGPDRCTGLLTCCTKYKAARESQMDFKCCLDIFGTDSSSLQKHVVKHFNDIKRTSENDAGLKIVLPEGIEWNEVIPNFTELDIDMENNAEFLNVHMAEWWRSPNSASVNPELYRTADLCLCFRICKKPVFS